MNSSELVAAAIKFRESNVAIRPTTIDGKDFYFVVLGKEQHKDILVAQARADWKDYYRSVRILRRIRLENVNRFKKFGFAWWDAFYKHEVYAPPSLLYGARRQRRLP